MSPHRDARIPSNAYVVNGDGTATIVLSNGPITNIDAGDLRRVLPFHWYASRSSRVNDRFYACTQVRTASGHKKRVRLHQVILPTERPYEVDHVDGDGLNNRQSNLRRASRSQNLGNSPIGRFNTSTFKGVSWHRQRGMWRATCGNKHLGLFADPLDASLAYDNAARERFGPFAAVNFPRNGERPARFDEKEHTP